MKNVKFSVIVPAYNASEWLEECIDSILCQTYKEFEIIIIDDGSSDFTWSLMKKIQFENGLKIKIYHQNNSGQIASRLKGIELADSDYCLFVDSDDTIECNALEIIESIINESNSDMIIFNGNRWSGGTVKSLYWPEYKEKTWTSDIDGVKEIREQVIRSKRFNNICFKAIKTSILKNTSNYKNVEFVRKEEDLLMQLPYFDAIKSVGYIPYELYNYRENSQSVTCNYNDGQFRGCCFVSQELKKYAKKWKISDYEMYCNTRFLQEVIVCIKQIAKAYGKNQRFPYFKEISRNDYFRKIMISKNYTITIKQRLILNLMLKNDYFFVNRAI